VTPRVSKGPRASSLGPREKFASQVLWACTNYGGACFLTFGSQVPPGSARDNLLSRASQRKVCQIKVVERPEFSGGTCRHHRDPIPGCRDVVAVNYQNGKFQYQKQILQILPKFRKGKFIWDAHKTALEAFNLFVTM
jgi:hypothetical protein